MTTEDKALFTQRLEYNISSSSSSTGYHFPLEFVVNENDSFQSTGNTAVFRDAADDIMLSSLIALKMQFHAAVVYGNCCSNFHLLLFDFLREGCGLATKVKCLQETTDYNVCCSWTRSAACEAIRTEFRQRHQQHQDRTVPDASSVLVPTTVNLLGRGPMYNRNMTDAASYHTHHATIVSSQ